MKKVFARVKEKVTFKAILIVILFALFPFVLEFILFVTPEVSRFSNEAWFSFIGSYIGVIATFIVLRITVKDNQKSIQDAKIQMIKSYEIEKEIALSTRILKILLLDNYNFVSANTLLSEYSKYLKDIFDIQYEIRYLSYDEGGITARDEFFHHLFLTERTHTSGMILEKNPHVENKETAKEYFEHIREYTTSLEHNMNSNRIELLNLYKKYIDEMKRTEFI